MTTLCLHGIWNINGLSPSKNEFKIIMEINKIDIALISETHMNDKKCFRLENYNAYFTNHPNGNSQGGSAVIIKQNIKHHFFGSTQEEYLQGTTITIEERDGPINVSAVYCPPRYPIKEDMLSCYFKTLGKRFISGGDWNCKHIQWGSAITKTRGRELKKCVDSHKLATLSTGEPTYWPTDKDKKPDLLDFFIIKGLSHVYYSAESCLDTISDHSLIIGTFSTTAIHRMAEPKLYNHLTDWNAFGEYLESELNLKVKLKSDKDIEDATFYITNKIQEAAWRSTPDLTTTLVPKNIPFEIRIKLQEKRKLRRKWQQSRLPGDRTQLNRVAKELKDMIDENENYTFREKVSTLSATKKDNYSLWKITKNYNRPQQHIPPLKTPTNKWAKTPQEKAELFGQHLNEVFKPNPSSMTEFEAELDKIIDKMESIMESIADLHGT